MITLAIEGQCPTCGYKFKDARLITGEPDAQNCNGICCMCGEIFKVDNGKIRVMTATEFIQLHPIDRMGITIAANQIEKRNKAEAAKGN